MQTNFSFSSSDHLFQKDRLVYFTQLRWDTLSNFNFFFFKKKNQLSTWKKYWWDGWSKFFLPSYRDYENWQPGGSKYCGGRPRAHYHRLATRVKLARVQGNYCDTNAKSMRAILAIGRRPPHVLYELKKLLYACEFADCASFLFYYMKTHPSRRWAHPWQNAKNETEFVPQMNGELGHITSMWGPLAY